MEGYLKETHRKLLKARKKYVFIENAKEMVWLLAWLSVTGGFSLIMFWAVAENRLSLFGIFCFALSPLFWALPKLLEILNERRKKEIIKEISAFAGEEAAFELLVLKFQKLMKLMDRFEREVGEQVPESYRGEAFFKRMKHFWEAEAQEMAEAEIFKRKRKEDEKRLAEEKVIRNFNEKYPGNFLETGKDER